jgi:KaiC/GvpD/RAD55 family RecA-like ATPase
MIKGLSKIIDGSFHSGYIILVTGETGTLKSTFAYNFLANHTKKSKCEGVYMTLEESADSLLKNLQSIGLKKSTRIHISDYRDLRKQLCVNTKDYDIILMVDDILKFFKRTKKNLKCFALDSLNALYSIGTESISRDKMFHFFESIRMMNMLCLMVLESSEGKCGLYNEPTLADGIMELGVIETRRVIRYVQIKKLRGIKHALRKHQLKIEDNELVVGDYLTDAMLEGIKPILF